MRTCRLVLLCCLTGTLLQAQQAVITDIHIEGNRRISEKRILETITLKSGSWFDSVSWEKDLRGILDLYARAGMILTQIDSSAILYTEDRTSVQLSAFISERDIPEIDTVAISGNVGVSTQELLSAMRVRKGQLFSPREVEADIESLLSLYDRHGFAFASIKFTDMQLANAGTHSGVSFVLEIEEGPRVRVTEWRTQTVTKPEVLTRELRMPLPAWFNREKIEQGLRRLRRLPFIADAQAGDLFRQNDSSWTMDLDVVEGLSNSIDGVLGYVPSQAGSKGYFMGFANLRFTNLLGTARRVDAQWQKKDRYSGYLYLAYTEPWLGGVPVDGTVSGEWLIQDTTYVNQAFSVKAAYHVDANWSVVGGAGRSFTTPVNSSIGFLTGNFDASFWTGFFEVSYDTRDYPLNPTRGLLYRAGVDYHRKRESSFIADPGGPDSLAVYSTYVYGRKERTIETTQRWSTELETVFPMTRQLILYNSTHAIWYRSPQAVPDRSELIRFGGLRTLRGYPEDFFEASRVVWNNLELRWITSRQSRIFAFIDAAYYLNKSISNGTLQTNTGKPVGYGFGIRYQTRAGIMALDFGLGRGDTFSQAKVHVGLATQF